MRAPRRASRLSEVLPGVLAGIGLDESLRADAAVQAWPAAVGERLARFVRAVSVRDGVLLLEAESNLWMQEIQLQKTRVIARLAEHCGRGVVRDLRLVLRRTP